MVSCVQAFVRGRKITFANRAREREGWDDAFENMAKLWASQHHDASMATGLVMMHCLASFACLVGPPSHEMQIKMCYVPLRLPIRKSLTKDLTHFCVHMTGKDAVMRSAAKVTILLSLRRARSRAAQQVSSPFPDSRNTEF